MDKPPYSITSPILNMITAICEKVGTIKAVHLDAHAPQFQKRNSIRTVQSSLEIEGNTLSVEQITAMLDGKQVIGPAKDILEAQNAVRVYGMLDAWTPYKLTAVCKAHKMLMKGLVERPGKLRNAAAGIVKGKRITHLAPGSEMVAPLMKNLLKYAQADPDSSLLKSCVFHYEFEFIHPFVDGNGRMGRLWQTLLLRQHDSLFEHLPIEPLINSHREDYYYALSKSDKEGNSTPFLEFMLPIINTALQKLLLERPAPLSGENRIEQFATKTGNKQFSRRDYMNHFKEISPATASRDLKNAVIAGMLTKSGEKRTTLYRVRSTGFSVR